MMIGFIILLFLCGLDFYLTLDPLAIEYYNKAVNQNDPKNPLISLQLYQKTLDINWDFPEAHQNIALLYETIGDVMKAKEHTEQSILHSKSPGFISKALRNYNNLYRRIPSIFYNEEIDHWINQGENILKQIPTDSEFLFTMGQLYESIGKPELARDKYQEIIDINPNHTLALLNYGNYLFNRAKLQGAIKYYELALQTVTSKDVLNYVSLCINIAQCYRELAQFQRSIQYLHKAYKHSQGHQRVSILIILYAVKGLANDWHDYEYIEELIFQSLHKVGYQVEAIRNGTYQTMLSNIDTMETPFDPYTLSLIRYSPAELDLWTGRRACKEIPRFPSYWENNSLQLSNKKIRIGVLSHDWRDHPMGRLTAAMITLHNRSSLEIHCLSYGKNDQSTIRFYIESYCDHFHDIMKILNHYDAANYIHSLKLDLLYDITSHTFNGRIDIANLHPAPIVINYLGFAGSTGCNGFDYSMVDLMIAPPDYYQAHSFSESLIYLPYTYQANFMIQSVFPQHTLQRISKRQFNQPLKYHLCSLNANKKYEPISFHVWMNILHSSPLSELYILDVNPEIQQEIILQSKFYGILPRRIKFITRLPWKEHLERIESQCDLILDNFIYGAHTTATDALWMGIPIMTLKGFGVSMGNKMPSRVPAAIVQSAFESTIKDSLSYSHLFVQDTIQAYEYSTIRLINLNKASYYLLRKHGLYPKTYTSPHFNHRLMSSYLAYTNQGLTDLRYLMINNISTPSKVPHMIVLSQETKHLKSKTNQNLNDCVFHDILQMSIQLKHIFIENFPDSFSMRWDITNKLPQCSSFLTVYREELFNKSRNIEGEQILTWHQHINLQFIQSLRRRLYYMLFSHIPIPSYYLDHFDCILQIIIDYEDVLLVANGMIQEETILDWNRIYSENSISQQVQLPDLINYWKDNRFLQANNIQYLHFLRYFGHLHYLSHIEPSYLLNQFRNYLQQSQHFNKKLIFQQFLQLYFLSNHTLLSQKTPISSQFDPCLFSGQLNLSHCFILPWENYEVKDILSFFRLQLFPMISHSSFNYTPSITSIYKLKSNYSFESVANIIEILHNYGIDQSTSSLRQAFHWIAHILFVYETILLDFPSHFNNLLSISQRFMNLGLILSQHHIQPWGSLLLHIATRLMHTEKFVEFNQINKKRVSLNSINPLSKGRIAIYCYEYGQAWWPGWGPKIASKLLLTYDTSILNKPNTHERYAVGGSEEAVIYISHELAKQGWEVDIYGEISDEEREQETSTYNHGRVKWRHFIDFPMNLSNQEKYHAFISWRYSLSLSLAMNSANKRFLWLHDLVDISGLPSYPSWNYLCSHGIFVQSEFHRNFIQLQYSNHSFPSIHILPNGVPPSAFPPITQTFVRRKKDYFVYASSPNRGLEQLLRFWSHIKSQLPNAELHIFYGFTDHVIERLTIIMGNSFHAWYQTMLSLLQQEGIVYHGAVSHIELSQFLQTSGFLLYPATFQETGCIVMLKSMAAGCIPITSRIFPSVLSNLGQQFDQGPDERLDNSLAHDQTYIDHWMINYYVPSVISAYHNANLSKSIREEMIDYIRNKYSWSQSSTLLNEVFS